MLKHSSRLWRFLFFDEVRLLELFSALNLIAWAELLLGSPEIFAGGSGAYRAFAGASAIYYGYGFGAVALLQLLSTFMVTRFAYEVRLIAMSFAAGAWSVVAVNFWTSGVSTTANLNYTLLALACAASGAFLGWKNTSFQS